VRVLVDTSVWSLALARRARRDSRPVRRLARAIEAGEVVLLGVILQETLQAFRTELDFRRATKALAAFPLLQLSRADYVEGARIHRSCAARGIAASTVDCQVAAAGVINGCALLTTDADFSRIAEICSLKLVRI
jgi:predicted nucleic acid-binding protein